MLRDALPWSVTVCLPCRPAGQERGGSRPACQALHKDKLVSGRRDGDTLPQLQRSAAVPQQARVSASRRSALGRARGSACRDLSCSGAREPALGLRGTSPSPQFWMPQRSARVCRAYSGHEAMCCLQRRGCDSGRDTQTSKTRERGPMANGTPAVPGLCRSAVREA